MSPRVHPTPSLYGNPVITGHVATDLARLGTADNGPEVWRQTEFHVYPNTDQYWVGVKRDATRIILPDGTSAMIADWSFLRVTPAQLRMLADAMERRQMTQNPQP